MSIEILTILMLAGTMALLAIGLPFAFTTGLIACTFALPMFGLPGLTLISSRTYSFMNEFVLASVPMFILMASILERSGVAHDLFNAVHIWAGGLPGGVGVATMLMAVLERTREIGILRAIGWAPRRVLQMILLEALVLSVAGAVVGMLLAVASVRGLNALPAAQGVVWVLENNAPKRVVIEVGGSDGQFTEVVSGPLKPGSVVITDQEQSKAK